MSRISNRQLVDELRSGHRLGEIHLVEMYRRHLIAECVRSFRLDPMDAEEIVDDVFVLVIRKIRLFSFKRSESDFHYWLMAIFRNKVRDFVRRGAVAGPDGPEYFLSSEVLAEGPESIRAAIGQYEGSGRMRESEVSTVVATLLNELEPWERVLLHCRALDMPYSDIATYTGKTVDQLKVYHARVQAKFKRMLADRFPALMQD